MGGCTFAYRITELTNGLVEVETLGFGAALPSRVCRIDDLPDRIYRTVQVLRALDCVGFYNPKVGAYPEPGVWLVAEYPITDGNP